MTNCIKLLAVILLISSQCYANELKPFTSDGCSSFPDGTFEQNELWLACCTAHDYSYWKGGTYQQRVDADNQLKSCVAAVGEEEVALVMLAGVRVGGSPYFPTSFRWGYGWPYPRLYGELTQQEQQQVQQVKKQQVAQCVILLHGLARSENTMKPLEKELTNKGFNVKNVGYESTQFTIPVLAKKAIAPAIKSCEPQQRISFVTHSMGGILVRQYLSEHNIPQLNRVVMLGPPNKGSEVVDKLGPAPGFHFINGDAGYQLGTGKSSIPNTLGKAEFDLGVIAGTRSINWILSSLIPGTDDGKVSVKNTKLEGMNDHISLAVTHPFMMKNKHVITQVVHYLNTGKFKHESAY